MNLQRMPVNPDSPQCSSCMMAVVCLPSGIPEREMAQIDQLIQERIRLKRGDLLFRQGENLDAIYALRLGSVKTQLEDAAGQMQITGFYLSGELVGMDGMIEGVHACNAVAMEDSEACVIRLEDIDEISRYAPSLQQQIRRLMSKEIERSHRMLMTLGSLRSEARLAVFLLNLSERLATLGYSSTDFVMRMSREEIGNFLGLTLETVSRLFSRFAREGLIYVNQREVRLIDIESLKRLAGQV